MRLPRWTTYPALAVLLGVAFVAIPKLGSTEEVAESKRVVVLGAGIATDVVGSATSGGDVAGSRGETDGVSGPAHATASAASAFRSRRSSRARRAAPRSSTG